MKHRQTVLSKHCYLFTFKTAKLRTQKNYHHTQHYQNNNNFAAKYVFRLTLYVHCTLSTHSRLEFVLFYTNIVSLFSLLNTIIIISSAVCAPYEKLIRIFERLEGNWVCMGICLYVCVFVCLCGCVLACACTVL